MKTKLSISTLFAIILAAILTGCSILGGNSGNSLLKGSGTIEADTIRLAPEIGG